MAIYVMLKVTGTTEAGWQLTAKQVDDLMKKRDEVVASVGGKTVAWYRSYRDGMSVCIYSYPSLEAAEKARVGTSTRQGLNLNRYWTHKSDILYEMPLER